MRRLIGGLLLLAGVVLSGEAMAQTIYNVSRFGVKPNTEKDAVVGVRKALEKIKKECKAGEECVLKFEKGVYHFYPKNATQQEYYISNHEQVNPKSVGIDLHEFENLTIDGQGSDFIFHGRMLPLALLDSKDCTLKNFSIDFDNPQITQVRILENRGDGGIVFEPAEWVQYRINDKQLFEAYGEGWSLENQWGIAFEGDTRHVVYNTSDVWCPTGECVEQGERRIYAPLWRDKRMIPGTVVAMRGWQRPAPGIFLAYNVDTRLENVTVHYAEGMGLLAQLCENITLEHFNVSLRGENDPRYFTTQADATHFSGCKGKITSCNGLYEGMMDDAINVHGTYLKVVKRLDDHTLVGRYMHDQTWGFKWGEKGDRVQFIKSNTMDLIGEENKVLEIRPYDQDEVKGCKEFVIRFEEEVDPAISEQGVFGIENLSWTPEVVFAGNTIRNNRARGSLFSTPKMTLVENNLFDHTSGTAILLCGDCNGWFETGACRNVVIRNNHFINALTCMFQFTSAVISIYPEIPNLKDQQKFFHGGGETGIVIEDNLFETFDHPILYAKSVDGLIYRNNKIILNNDYPAFHTNKNRFKFERVTNLEIDE